MTMTRGSTCFEVQLSSVAEQAFVDRAMTCSSLVWCVSWRGCCQDSRVLDVQDGFVWEMDVEGHCRGCRDNICPMLLLQPLVEDFHVKQTQKAVHTKSR